MKPTAFIQLIITFCIIGGCLAQQGACCLPYSLQCVQLSATECANSTYVGIYSGDGTVCEFTKCCGPDIGRANELALFTNNNLLFTNTPTPLITPTVNGNVARSTTSGPVTLNGQVFNPIDNPDLFTSINARMSDLVSQMNDYPCDTYNLFTVNAISLNGQTISPGVRCIEFNTVAPSNTIGMSSILTFNAQNDPDAIFIVKATRNTVANAQIVINLTGDIVLSNGAQSKNIFWIAQGEGYAGVFLFQVQALVYGNLIGSQLNIQQESVLNGRFINVGAFPTAVSKSIVNGLTEPPSCTSVNSLAIIPTVCVIRSENGTCTSYWGYRNLNPAVISVPIGPENQISGNIGTVVQSQPSLFQPGQQSNVFTIEYECTDGTEFVTWNVTSP